MGFCKLSYQNQNHLFIVTCLRNHVAELLYNDSLDHLDYRTSAFVSCCWYWSWFVYSGIAYELHSGSGPSTYIHCMVCYRSPISKKCCHIFTHHYTLDNDSECSMDYDLSLLLKVFTLRKCITSQIVLTSELC